MRPVSITPTSITPSSALALLGLFSASPEGSEAPAGPAGSEGSVCLSLKKVDSQTTNFMNQLKRIEARLRVLALYE
ncbi:MAG: hypothetical protein UHP27_02265, partial [Muribaculaceae bacterium]|nr:hypothetical protein [Muribaculaceae bacterium]